MQGSLLVDLVVGARPNFVKVAPLIHSFKKRNQKIFSLRLVHTGQHYDYEMSKSFFDDLQIPSPDVYLGAGSGSHGYQTGRIMIEYEKVLFEAPPNLVMVFGDVNSTVAAALVATKMSIPVAHVEAGLRSFDLTMPEEINRMLTDRISRYLFTTEESGTKNLRDEGVPEERIFYVGNIMIDSLLKVLPKSEDRGILKELGLKEKGYALLTLHRPSNVDLPENLREILGAVQRISKDIPVVFPVHPRTKKRMREFGLSPLLPPGVIITEPQSYVSFLTLERFSSLVMTDSGGIQEETTFLGIPCLTLRENTERPVTVEMGTNVVVGVKGETILKEVGKILEGRGKNGRIPPLWDGKTAERIVDVFLSNPPETTR